MIKRIAIQAVFGAFCAANGMILAKWIIEEELKNNPLQSDLLQTLNRAL